MIYAFLEEYSYKSTSGEFHIPTVLNFSYNTDIYVLRTFISKISATKMASK